jgi:NAD(P)-dependent dehydrogenase (short-subunit alcohol dehydrogenase family)
MLYNPFSLENKKILVTGASSGIGQSISLEASMMGAEIILSARDEKRLTETLQQLQGENHTILTADLTNQNEVESLVSNVDKIDGLVLSAGKGLTLPFMFSDYEKFNSIFNINFFSQVELLRLLVKKKKFNRNASIVVIVSIGGVNRFSVGNSIYGSSKAALNSIIHFVSQELASKLIRVNGICPGMVETPLIRKGTLTDEQLKLDMSKYPLGRYGKPEDIAYGAIYLLSDASSWVTGHSLVIDGGITAK